jgi:hypothetical protein
MSVNLVASPAIFVDGKRSGSCSCVWTDGAGVQYLLSASHVVADVPPYTPVQWMSGSGVTGDGQTLDAGFNWMPLNDGGGGLLDASLIRINNAGPFARTGTYPWATAVPLVGSGPPLRGSGAVICGKSGPIFATYDGIEPAGQWFSNHVHGALLRFAFDFPVDHTSAGDSGGPVIATGDQLLIGVHVAITDDHRFAWAVPIDDVQRLIAPNFPGLSLRP